MKNLFTRILVAVAFILILVPGVFTACSSSSIEVSGLTVNPAEPGMGEPVNVSAKLTNTSSDEVTYVALLQMDGIDMQSRKVVIQGNESLGIGFSITPEKSGEHELTIGGASLTFTVTEESSGSEIATATLSVMSDVSTFQYEQDFTLNIQGTIGEDEGQVAMVISMLGSVDKPNQKLLNDSSSSMELSEQDSFSADMVQQMYQIGDTAYSFVIYNGESYGWTKEPWTFGTWGNISGIELQLGLLENSIIQYSGTETYNGRECYALSVIPDSTSLVNALNAYDDSNNGYLPLNQEAYTRLAENSRVMQWIYKDDSRLAGFEISMAGLVPANILETDATGFVNVVYTVTGIYKNYNEPVEIELPTDALMAVDVETPVTGYDDQTARDTELGIIQSAVQMMMQANKLTTLPNPVGPTNDMGAFPDMTPAAEKGMDINGSTFTAGDKDGFVLYQHDRLADGDDSANLVDYLVPRYSAYQYMVDINGTVIQMK